MNTKSENVLDFALNFTVTKKIRKGFLSLSSYEEKAVILNNVRGQIKSKTLTAILGASGCGKTTLLAALSQRLRDGTLTGQIILNGEVMDRSKMTKISGFLPQSDVILDGITVREHFYFMIEFKLPNISKIEKLHLIQNSLRKFGLNGSTKLKNLSGGEKRRLSLATELLTKPQLLFIDECTSGLDSFSALSVVNTLRELADSRIVLLSIHQPTSDIFHLFTNILLLNAGKIIFHGTVDEAKNLFESMNKICPPMYNPAEFYVNTISDPKQCTEIVDFLSPNKATETNNYDTDELHPSSLSEMSLDHSRDYEKISWTRQCIILSHRKILNFSRSPNNYLILFVLLFFHSLIVMSVYTNISLESDTAVQDIQGFIFVFVTEILFVFVYAVFTLIYVNIPLLRQETGNRLYSLSAYYTSLILLMIPRIIIETTMYTSIIYFSTNIGRDFFTFFNILLSMILSGICAMAYGFFLSGFFVSLFVGVELSGLVDMVIQLASGVYLNVKYVSWLKYISFFFYANETISIMFWSKIDSLKCHPNPEIRCFSNGTDVLEYYGFMTEDMYICKDYIYQFILTIILHILAFWGVKRNVGRSGFY